MTIFSKKNIILCIAAAGIIIAVFCYISNNVLSLQRSRIEKVVLSGRVFYAELVTSNEKMQKGLGGRDALCQSCAMLFQFSDLGRHAFWMKDMRFPLDIIWISGGKITYLEKNVSENFSAVMIPPTAADQVLEINSGISDKLGIKVGDAVK